MNVVLLSGRLGNDPEVRYTPAGKPVANFSLYVNGGKDKDGNALSDRFQIISFNRLAEVVSEHLAKGQKALVKGELRSRSFEDKDGNKRFVTEVWANFVEFIGARPNQNKSQDTQGPGSPERPGAAAPETAGMEFGDDDIPF